MTVLRQDLSDHFRTMSFLCACMVVLIHSTTHPPEGSVQWWLAFVFGSRGVCRIAVPFFFVASGFFFSGRLGEKGWYLYALKSRVKSILVPFYVWTFVTILVCFVIHSGIRLTGYNYEGGCFQLPTFSFAWLAAALGVSPYAGVGASVWYLRTLFLFVLISPISFGLLDRRWEIALLTIFCVFCVVYDMGAMAGYWNSWTLTYFFSLKGAFFFMLGVVLRQVGVPSITRRVQLLFSLIGFGLIIAKGVFLLTERGLFAGFIEMPMIVVVMISIWSLIGNSSMSKIVTSLAFPIYLMHAYFIWFASAVFALFGLSVYGEQSLVAMMAKFTFAMSGSVLSAVLARRFCPKVARIAFGGR